MDRVGLYSGFDSFRVPTGDDLRQALQTGTVAVDTNVLLNLYRYNEQTVADLLEILNAVKERLFVPHQVMREFWRNRQSVIAGLGSATKDTFSAFDKNRTSTQDAIRRWAKSVALAEEERESLLVQVDRLFSELQERLREEPVKLTERTPTIEDSLLSRLEPLLDGAVGAPLSESEWRAAVEEGERRVESSEPPGYMDAEKLESDLAEGASGDYLVWYQLLKAGESQRTDLVLVTADTKEDWWNRGTRGEIIGPRRELVDEYFKAAGGRLYLFEPSHLLKYSSVLGIGTSEESLHDVERVQNEQPAAVPWTIEAVKEVLAELQVHGHIQAEVIHEAARNGGRISRKRIYELDGREESQMLRGFTRPVKRLTAELQDRGRVPFGVAPLLDAVYETGVKSSHFSVPPEVVDLLGDDWGTRPSGDFSAGGSLLAGP